jgi:hypothetical protein
MGNPNIPPITRIPAKQLGGVESPATVLLSPVDLGDAGWWSHDQLLLGGIKADSPVGATPGVCRVRYMPLPVPRSWAKTAFCVVVEYEAEPNAMFVLRTYYGCGDPSELHVGSESIRGIAGKKQRAIFRLDEAHLARNELFRATLEVIREAQPAVYVYGAWLEIGV